MIRTIRAMNLRDIPHVEQFYRLAKEKFNR